MPRATGGSIQFYKSMRPSIITLTTDFGTSDHYVGTMKGVMLSRCPDATLVDITHGIPPFSIHAGAYAIDQAAPYFPPGTVHVIVVDPGVGTERRPMMAEALGQYFVAPDNGVLSLIFNRDPHARCHELSNDSLWLRNHSKTFHGRDIFAPVAAHLASGQARASDVGPPLNRPEMLPDFKPVQEGSGHWRGTVLSVDHFGNVITNFRSTEFGQELKGSFLLENASELRGTFHGAKPGSCFVYFGSSGYLEIGMNQESAAERLNLRSASPVRLKVAR